MEFEDLNTITGLVSAIGAAHGLVYFHRTNPPAAHQQVPVLSTYKLTAFFLGWSGWSLACLCALWLFQPFGSGISSNEYKQFYAVLFSFPAITMLIYGLYLLHKNMAN